VGLFEQLDVALIRMKFYQERFEETNGVIRRRKSKKDRLYKSKKDKEQTMV